MERLIELALLALAGYLGVGVMLAAPLHVVLARLDPAARGAGLRFRLLITPGLVALWPVVVRRWRVAARGGSFHAPTERVKIGALRSLHGPLSATAFGAGVLTLVLAVVSAPPPPSVTPLDAIDGPRAPLSLAPLGPALDPALRLTLAGSGTNRQLELELPMSLAVPGLAVYWRAAAPDADASQLDQARFLGAAGRSGLQRLELPSECAGGFIVLTSGEHTLVAQAPLPDDS